MVSGASSPLTSLSSLEEEEDPMFLNSARVHKEMDEFSAAQVGQQFVAVFCHSQWPPQLLCDFSNARRPERSRCYNSNARGASKLDRGIQTDLEPPKIPPTKNKVGRPRKVRKFAEGSIF